MKEIKYQAWSNKYQQMFRVDEISMTRDGYVHGTVDAGFSNEYFQYLTDEERKSPLNYIGRVDFVKSIDGRTLSLFQDPSAEEFYLREYTNLNDDNGTEIYTGDIVKRTSRGKEIVGAVVFEQGAYVIIDETEKRHFLYPTLRQKTVVIGDVFRNPNLVPHLLVAK